MDRKEFEEEFKRMLEVEKSGIEDKQEAFLYNYLNILKVYWLSLSNNN
jgi:hypothetical protein